MPDPDSTAPVRARYNADAAAYDQRWSRYTAATIGAALDHLNCTGGERVLDLGCGTGELVRRLAGQWPDLALVGMDLSEGMLARAVRKLAHHPGAAFAAANAADLPFADESFEVVVSTNAFHYFREPARTVEEMRRVLKPGGRLVVVDWCHDYWTCKLCQWYLRLVDPAHYRMYTLRECDGQLTAAGLQTVSQRRFKISLLWGLMVAVAVKPAAATGGAPTSL